IALNIVLSLILFHTSICFPIYQVVHRQPHRVEGLEVRHRVWQGNLHAWFGIVSLTRSAPRPTPAGQGQSGCVSIIFFKESTNGLGKCLCLTALLMTSMVRDRGKCTG